MNTDNINLPSNNKCKKCKNCQNGNCENCKNCNCDKGEKKKSSVEFWANDPNVLIDKDTVFEIWPKESMTRERKINAISRLVLYLTLLGVLISQSVKVLITGIVTLVILVVTYFGLNRKSNAALEKSLKEGFSDEALYEKFRHNYTNPTTQNPVMNVLVPEIQDNPQRLQAAPAYNKAVEKQLNESVQNIVKKNFNDETIDDKLFKDTGDKFEFEQSMRQFYTTPNTLVPNNQKDFAQFCYGNMASCKDGDVEMCLKATYNHVNI